MKKRMQKRESLGKVSRFLQGLKRKASTISEARHQRNNARKAFPNSSKVGAGSVVARRSLNNTILHKRNHRSNEIIGYKQ